MSSKISSFGKTNVSRLFFIIFGPRDFNELKFMYLWAPPILNLEIFLVQKINYWLGQPTLMTPFERKLAKTWSIRVEVPQVTRVEHWISCFKPCIVQNWWYFWASTNANFVQTALFSRIMCLLFSYIVMLTSPRTYDSFASLSIEGKFLFRILRKPICK